MKRISYILVFIFLAFLSTPTIITLIEKTKNSTLFFDISEEEQGQKEIKEITYYVYDQFLFQFEIRTAKSKLILSENLSKHDNVTRSIFSPPPDLV